LDLQDGEQITSLDCTLIQCLEGVSLEGVSAMLAVQ
jgi:hypothetical protein